MPTFAVACFETGTDLCVSLHIIEGESWREALNRSPAIWWNTPADMAYDDALAFAHAEYRCHVSVKNIAELTR